MEDKWVNEVVGITTHALCHAAALLFCALALRVDSSLAPKDVRDDKRLVALDGLRGFLALSVLVHHGRTWWLFAQYPLFGQHDVVFYRGGLGGVAVRLFFMISGAVFYPRLRKADEFNVGTFFVQRVLRIVPLYWLLCLIVGVGALLEKNGLDVPFGSFAKSIFRWLFFVQMDDINGTWITSVRFLSSTPHTLWVEWKFYSSLPTLFALMFVAGKVRVPKLLLILACLYGVRAHGDLVGQILGKEDAFYFGILACELQHVLPEEWKQRSSTWPSRVFLSSLIASVWLLTLTTHHWPDQQRTVLDEGLLFALFFAVLMGSDCFKLLDCPSAALLGRISYSLYLLHGLIFYGLHRLHLMDSLVVSETTYNFVINPVAACIAISLSCVSFKFVERPMQNLGHLLLAHAKA